MDCNWLPPNHTLFQCANICLALSYFAKDTLNGLLFLRFVLGAAGVFFGTWGWFILCSLDTCLWNFIFAVLHYAHFIYLMIKIYRPVKLKRNHEIVFRKLFEPLGVKRFQYKALEEDGYVLELKSGEVYALEHHTKAEKLSILVKGSLQVSSQGLEIHIQRPFDFVDSPEWVASTFSTDDTDPIVVYGVTLTAMDDIICLTWKIEDLRKKLNKDRMLKNIFDSIIGRDITTKLFGSIETLHLNRGGQLSRSSSFDSLVYINQFSDINSNPESASKQHTVKFSGPVIKHNTADCQNGIIGTAAPVIASPKLISKLRRETTDMTSKVRSDSIRHDLQMSHMAMNMSTSDHSSTEYVTLDTATDLREERPTLTGAATPKVLSKLRREETDMLTRVRSDLIGPELPRSLMAMKLSALYYVAGDVTNVAATDLGEEHPTLSELKIEQTKP